MNAFSEFGIIVVIASTFAIFATKLKQPAILGYIIAGITIKLWGGFHIDHEQLELFSQLGITLLLFILGLELNINELKSLGKVASVAGLGQIIFSFISGYGIASLMGFGSTGALYIALALTFSSTIVVVKLLSSKKELEHLYGRISVGLLLVQDFLAIFIIIALSAISNLKGSTDFVTIASQLGLTLLKGGGAVIAIFGAVKLFINPLLTYIHKEKEVLFLTVIAWALLVASVMSSKAIGFSIEIGGLIAGIALSSRFESLQIESWTKPLRDFFLMLFFVLLGLNMDLSSFREVIGPALLLSILIVLLKPAILIFLLRRLKYSYKVSFMAGLALAQISEFSIIVAKIAKDLGHLEPSSLTLITLVGCITMTMSSYMIVFSEKLFVGFQKLFKWQNEEVGTGEVHNPKYKVILFGCHRMGRNILTLVPHIKEEILIIDQDPNTVKALRDKGYHAVFGDISDSDLYGKLLDEHAEMVISTVPSLKENRQLLTFINTLYDTPPLTVITANDDLGTEKLYEYGADFVVYPHLLGGELIAQILKKRKLTKKMVTIRSHQMQSINLKLAQ